jgi:hypothetical protein
MEAVEALVVDSTVGERQGDNLPVATPPVEGM